MPKVKTHSGLNKRVKKTKNGKVKRLKKGKNGAAFIASADLQVTKRALH